MTTPTLRHPDCLFIGGEWVAPSNPRTFALVNPATEEVGLHIAAASKSDIDEAVQAARKAFDAGPWPKLQPAERARYLREFARCIRERELDFAHAWTSQSGLVFAAASQFSAGAAGLYDWYADLADCFAFEESHTPGDGVSSEAYLVREPVGVVAAIIPWNGPLFLLSLKCAPALLAGCPIILKASPEAPLEAKLIAEIAQDIGLPPGVLNVVTADRDVSEYLVAHPGVDKITVTGSTQAGKRIAAVCADRLARVTMELGGKSAALILDDFPADEAARSLAQSTAFNAGQVCAALTRVIVPRRRYQDLLDALVAEFRAIQVGDPYQADVQMGPLAMQRQHERVMQYIEAGCADGATLCTGGRRPAGLDRGFYVEPTVFGDVDNRSQIAREEIFGPVLCVTPCQDEDDAVRLANDSPYGLAASVFTRDADRAFSLARRIRSGTVSQNGSRGDFTIAFGGFKQSGLGREGGVEGLLPYLETKTILLDGTRGHA